MITHNSEKHKAFIGDNDKTPICRSVRKCYLTYRSRAAWAG